MQRTLENLVDYWVEKTPHNEAVCDGVRRLTYKELRREINLLVGAFGQIGLKRGDKIITFLSNWHEFIILICACAKIGAILVPLNPLLEKDEIDERIQIIEPRLIFIANETHFSFVNGEGCLVVTVRFKKEKYLSFNDLLKLGENGGKEVRAPANDANDSFVIIFTSGTTGAPKGVEQTVGSITKTIITLGSCLRCSNQDIFLSALPVCHLFGINSGILMPLYFGGKIICMEKFTPDKALDLIAQEKASLLFGVPTMFIRELHEHRKSPRDVTSLRTGIIAGANCSMDLINDICFELHCNVMVVYGLTELPVITMTELEDNLEIRGKTVGRPVGGVQIKIVNDNGVPVEPGKEGELICKGPCIMKGYYHSPEETKKVFDENGWLYTGDLAAEDEFGYIRILGRKKELINRGGYKIYPAEIESVYYKSPVVLEVCVLGMPHDELGEKILAFIALKNNCQETQESLREYAKGKIAKYKVPDKVVLVENMPKLANGKIDKKMLLNFLRLPFIKINNK